MKLIKWLAACILLIPAACTSIDSISWKEQVRLHDDRIIEVDRTATRFCCGFPMARRGGQRSEGFRYAELGVVWDINWINDTVLERPIAFDIFDGEAFLVVLASPREIVCAKNHISGDYAAIIYRWKNGKREVIPQSDAPIDEMFGNIALTYWAETHDRDPKYISLVEQARRNLQPVFPPTTLRQAFGTFSRSRCQ